MGGREEGRIRLPLPHPYEFLSALDLANRPQFRGPKLKESSVRRNHHELAGFIILYVLICFTGHQVKLQLYIYLLEPNPIELGSSYSVRHA